MFDRVFSINLDRRPDRWKQFIDQVPADWPLPKPERFRAIDGQRIKPPRWWTAGSGAWGCYRSHLQIIETALNESWHSVLILEDDAQLCDDFSSKMTEAMESIPDDWGMAYLGGQHRFQRAHPPERVNDHWDRPYDVNRTHAYAARGDMLEVLYQYLHGWQSWQLEHHIDHHYGRLHQDGGYAVYTVRPWLIGQRSGWSNICGDEVKTRFWDGHQRSSTETPMVAVLGVFRGGTSCVAGVLHTLGVHMGNQFKAPARANPRGFFEASQLAGICRQSYREPGMREVNDYATRVRRLSDWAVDRRKEAARDGRLAGGKHPTLCLMVPEVIEAWGRVKFLRVVRPIQETMRSLRRLGWRQRQNVIQRMIDKRDQDLMHVAPEDVLDVPYASLCSEPEATVDRIIEFLGLAVESPQRADAIGFVEPDLAHASKCCG